MRSEAGALETAPLLALMPADVRRLVAASFVPVEFGFGETLVREGDPSDSVFVLVEGRARVVTTDGHEREVTLTTLGPGDSFGEVGVLEDSARTATVRASGPVRAMRLDGVVLRAMATTNPEVEKYLRLHVAQSHLRTFLQTEDVFGSLPAEATAALIQALKESTAAAGDVVVAEGEPTGPMYIVREGRLRASQGGHVIRYLRQGDVFGERSLFTGEPRSATVEALTDVRLLRLPTRGFKRLLADYPAFRDAIAQRVEQYEYASVARVPLDFADEVLPADAAVEPVGDDQLTRVAAEALEEELPGVEASPAAKRPRIKRFPLVRQVDEADCGAACLAMVCRHFGRAVSLSRVRHAVRTSTDGTSLRGLTSGADELGLSSRALKVSRRNLGDLALPAIVHWGGNHWVVLYDVAGDRVRLADPALGRRRLTRAQFDEKFTGFAAVFEPTPAFAEAPTGPGGFGWLAQFFRPYRARLILAVVLALVVSAVQLVVPVLTQIVVDRVLPRHDVGLLNVIVLSLVAVVALLTAGTMGQRLVLARVAVGVDRQSLDQVAGRLLSLPLSFFTSRRTGDIQRRLAGMQQLRQFMVENGVLAITCAARILTAVVLMLVYSRVLGLLFLAAAPVYAGLVRVSRTRLRPIYDSLEESFSSYHSRQIDAIKGVEAVKAMGAEDLLRKDLLREFDGLSSKLYQADLASLLFEGAVQLVGVVILAAFVWVGALQVLNGNLTVGQLVSFNALVLFANAPIQTLLALWDHAQLASVLLTRLSDVFEEEPEQGADHSGLRPVPTLAGDVAFERLTLRYGGPAAPAILDGIDLDVPAGTTVAVVGRSGSGKTTLVKCLAGLLEPSEGRILYDGVDMTTLEYRQLRRRIGFVLQENYLFSGTIAENIAFGEERPDLEQVEWAARMANAHEFIVRLPLRYDTRVGETGLLLSGGQKQRVAIARAVYHRPPVLIFDEATSSLDTESERAVQENLARVLEGRTSFVIAHRLSTIRDADLIVVLERGRVAETGGHDDLMARKGLYYFLVSQQLGM